MTEPTMPLPPPAGPFRDRLVHETLYHLFPWTGGFLRQRGALALAGIGLAVAATVAWLLAAAGRMHAVAVLAWWIGWSVYEVLCRRRCKPFIKEGPWWRAGWRPAGTTDLIFYVATKNLLIAAALFLLLAALGTLAP